MESREDPQSVDRVRAMLEHLLKAFPVGVIGIDEHTEIKVINGYALNFLGVKAEKTIGRKLRETPLPCQRCFKGDEPKRLAQSRVVTAGGGKTRRRTVLWSCVPVEADADNGAGCVVGLFDISEKQELAEKVFAAKEEMEAIFDSITDPTFMVDRERKIRRANTSFAAYAKKGFSELLGKGCSEILGEDAELCAVCPVMTVFETGKAAKIEIRIGSGKTYLINYFPVVTHLGVDGVVVRYHDITSRKNMEAKLIQSEKMAAVGQLVAGVAHEINNPAAFVLSNLNRLRELAEEVEGYTRRVRRLLDLAAEGKADQGETLAALGGELTKLQNETLLPDLGEMVAESFDGIGRIHKIVNDLKLFSHKGSDAKEPADINACIDSTLNIVWNELKRKCEIVKDYGLLPKVVCNRQQIGQALMNLLVNAAQAVDKKGVITITTRHGGEGVTIAVADTGMGIAPEHIPQLFQPFFTTKPLGRGTGMGLYLVAKFVRGHGGTIEVESRPGEGSRFIIRLPESPPKNLAVQETDDEYGDEKGGSK